jgi:hypothetical protein
MEPKVFAKLLRKAGMEIQVHLMRHEFLTVGLDFLRYDNM